MTYCRKPSQDRRAEILRAASRVFAQKGFIRATMEDVVAHTSLSKGGVYHYYPNVIAIAYDLFLEGNRYRLDVMQRYLAEHHLDASAFTDPNILADLLTEKVLTNSPEMHLYAQFLVESTLEPQLAAMREKLFTECHIEIEGLIPTTSHAAFTTESFEVLTALINSLIVGCTTLGYDTTLRSHRSLIKKMIKIILCEIGTNRVNGAEQ